MPLFLFIFSYFYNIHTYTHSITFIQYIYPSPFAEASLHFFIACLLSREHLPVVPSRESNSGLPYSKPTRYQLSNAAPIFKAVPCTAQFCTVLYCLACFAVDSSVRFMLWTAVHLIIFALFC
jgi:hypothetical protein